MGNQKNLKLGKYKSVSDKEKKEKKLTKAEEIIKDANVGTTKYKKEIHTQLINQQKTYQNLIDSIKPEADKLDESIKTITESNELISATDFMDIKANCRERSLKFIDSILKQSFRTDNPELKDISRVKSLVNEKLNSDFIQNKLSFDTYMYSKILYQVEIAELATTRLITIIDSGDVQPRFYEVLAALQRSSIDLFKFTVQFQNIIELTYKSYFDMWLIDIKELQGIGSNEKKKLPLKLNIEDAEIVSEEEQDDGEVRSLNTNEILNIINNKE